MKQSEVSSRPAHQFVFLGNGAYANRGCEAIVRGTMVILREAFGKSLAVRSGIFAEENAVLSQNLREDDPAVSSFRLTTQAPRWSREWWEDQARNRFGLPLPGCNRLLLPELSRSAAVLDVGGDNYSLDYGMPEIFVAMDRMVKRKHVPLVLWGASVGPFDAEPVFASKMFKHLRGFDAVLVRETESLDYLRENDVNGNVHLVADPAFLMISSEPDVAVCEMLPADFVGVNVSPLIARTYSRLEKQAWAMTSADIEPWLKSCAMFVKELTSRTGLRVVLIPHVESVLENNNDYIFMQNIFEQLDDATKRAVLCLQSGLSASKLKWVIARSAVFVGARTHATIAAMSSGVPTVSIGYSVKARGINRDVFGCLDFCIDAREFDPCEAVRVVEVVLEQRGHIRARMKQRLPEIGAAARKAGTILRQILSERVKQ